MRTGTKEKKMYFSAEKGQFVQSDHTKRDAVEVIIPEAFHDHYEEKHFVEMLIESMITHYRKVPESKVYGQLRSRLTLDHPQEYRQLKKNLLIAVNQLTTPMVAIHNTKSNKRKRTIVIVENIPYRKVTSLEIRQFSKIQRLKPKLRKVH